MELSSVANGWVESYLEALLSTGLSSEHSGRARELAVGHDADKQICAKYYVQQVLNLNEEGIRQAWGKASAASLNPTERDSRLEYLSWRVWAMKRKKAMVVQQRLREDSRDYDTAPLEDGFELMSDLNTPAEPSIEYLDLDKNSSLTFATLANVRARISSPDALDRSDDILEAGSPPLSTADPHLDDEHSHRLQKLYVVMISMHGLVRGEKMELGRDPDTGGQVKYVVELAKALSRHPAVHRVDLLTRLIQDPEVDKTYGVEEEALLEPQGQCGGAYIVRLACGPPQKYIRKEALWPHIREFADRGIRHVRGMQARLAAAGEGCELFAVHGHYGDAGEAAALMSHTLGCTMLLTGHSLGRNKLEHLLKSSSINRAEIEATYNIARRIEGEERALDAALMVFTSTQQEITEQWGLYDGYDPHLERAARFRKARHLPVMSVTPPGLDFSNLKVTINVDAPAAGPGNGIQGGSAELSRASSGNGELQPVDSVGSASSPMSPPIRTGTSNLEAVVAATMADEPPIWKDIFRFLRNPYKPVILAMSRPDNKKNIATLIHAFGKHPTLRHLANLVLIMGNREIIDSMARGSRQVLEQVLKLIDDYDLHGSVAYPKHHQQQDISDIYLLASATRGVFVNIALQEPFGLTLIEAAAHGLPIVATKNGGPVDIIHTLRNGVLVEPTDAEAVGTAMMKILTSQEIWDEYSRNACNNIQAYSWPAHCSRYLKAAESEACAQQGRLRSFLAHSHSMDGLHRMLNCDAVGDLFVEEGLGSAGGSAGDLAVLTLTRASTTPGEVGTPTTPFSPTGSFSMPSLLLDDTRLRDMGSGHEVKTVRLASRPRAAYNVLLLEGRMSTAHVAAAFKSMSTGNAGLGVISFLGYKQTLQLLKICHVETRALDFVIASGGSELWYAESDGSWEYDEAFEKHVEVHWERNMLRRAVTRIVAQLQPQGTPAASKISMQTAGSMGDELKRASSLARRSVELLAALHPRQQDVTSKPSPRRTTLEASGVHLVKMTGPFHLRLDLAPSSPWDATRLATLLRRRLRRGGIRTHVVAQAAERQLLSSEAQSSETGLTSSVHITPQRGTRAMALRYLAHRFDIPLERFTLQVAGVPLPVHDEERSVLFAASDASDVLGGLQSVRIIPLQAAAGAGSRGGSAWCQVDIGVFGERVQILKVQPDAAAKASMAAKVNIEVNAADLGSRTDNGVAAV